MAFGTYIVAVEGLTNYKDIENLPADILRSAIRAINDTTRKVRTQAAGEMRRQINFPARYLTGQDGRLRITQYADHTRLEGKITGRHRPTSLARFATSGQKKRGGVTVQVGAGRSSHMKRAFLMKLRSGSAAIDTQHNLGLAIRLKPGEKISNKKIMAKAISTAGGSSLYLLWGPSVSHVFAGVADDIVGDAVEILEREFLRQLDLR